MLFLYVLVQGQKEMNSAGGCVSSPLDSPVCVPPKWRPHFAACNQLRATTLVFLESLDLDHGCALHPSIRHGCPSVCAAAAVKAEENEEGELWGGGEYHCMAAYPSPSCSMQLGRQNLHLFRLKNTRFDVIGGIFYFCLVVCAV